MYLWYEGMVTYADMHHIASRLALELTKPSSIHIMAPMGAGKSTFARMLFEAKGCVTFAGSPTFGIVHEYQDGAHMDFYRLKHKDEVEAAGIPEYFFARSLMIVTEWIDLFPDFYHELYMDAPGPFFSIQITVEGEVRCLSIKKRRG